jgi:aryl-alcohol dehydrogenase-like predicted oxidoreductase
MSVESSLRRLQTDWIDLFQMHAWDPKTPIEETWSTLNDLVTAGTVRYLGVSQYAAWQIAQTMGVAALHGWESLVSVQPEYSLVSRGAERELLPLARQSNLAVMPWSPLGGGILTGKYRPGEAVPEDSRAAQASPAAGMVQDRLSTQVLVLEQVQRTAAALEKTAAQVALNWVLDSPGVTSPVVGARTVEQLQQNLGAVGWVMPVAERAALDDASALQVDYPESAMQALGLRVY